MIEGLKHAPGFEARAKIVSRAKARIAKSQVKYGNEVAYPADMELMLDLVGLVDSLETALAIELDRLASDRELRTGRHVLETARSMGWTDHGEGALEFMLRRAREVAFEDCGKAAGEVDR